jgi:hypothetical protein
VVEQCNLFFRREHPRLLLDLEPLRVVDPRRGVAERSRLSHELAKLLSDLVDRPGLQLRGELHEKPLEVRCCDRGAILSTCELP